MVASAQQKINQTHSTAGINEIKMVFKYPELIKITTWERQEISITGEAMINRGEHNDAFKLEVLKDDGILSISSIIENLSDLPNRIMISRDGEKYYFPTDDFQDPKVQEFLKNADKKYDYQMHGVIKEIQLEIKVPNSIVLDIVAKYGLVELKNIMAPVTVEAKYGGIDMTLPASANKKLTARTKYGEIFSDLELNVDSELSESGTYHKWTNIVALLNQGGPKCYLESKYGNVYIRSAK